jgi:hypothetical protein
MFTFIQNLLLQALKKSSLMFLAGRLLDLKVKRIGRINLPAA